jgi:undecaprenyl-diphosphatase
MIPVLIIGLFFKDFVEQFFDGNLPFVGLMLLCTGFLLLSTTIIKNNTENLSPLKSFVIGVAQAIAVMPGISRSGATIATGLLLKVDKTKMARFSFLMVIPPILGMLLIDVKKMISSDVSYTTEPIVLIAGFVAAFLTGLLACTLMIEIVKKGKIQYFAYYCFVVGLIAIGTLWF